MRPAVFRACFQLMRGVRFPGPPPGVKAKSPTGSAHTLCGGSIPLVPNPVMSPGFSGKPTSPDIGRLQSFMEEWVFTGLEVRVRPVSGLHESELLLAADH